MDEIFTLNRFRRHYLDLETCCQIRDQFMDKIYIFFWQSKGLPTTLVCKQGWARNELAKGGNIQIGNEEPGSFAKLMLQ